MTDADLDETDIDEVDLLILDLAEIFAAYNVAPAQALEYITENYPVTHIALLSESNETIH